MFILSLLLLIAAFLGLDLNGDTGSTGRCTAGYSPGFEDVAPGDYSNDWYAWEWCLFNGGWPAEGDFSQYGTHQQSLQVAQFFVNEVWHRYTPWMEVAIEADAPSMNASVKGKVKSPTVHMGLTAIAEHCPVGSFGCGGGGSMRWRGSQLNYRPGVIVVRDINIFPLLHELAHAIDGHQWWQGSQGIEALVNECTNGHGLSFKCLALDLYNITGSLNESVYETLNGLCQRYAPTYAQPTE